MRKYLRKEIKELKAYELVEREYRLKLDANEGIDWINGLNRYPLDRSDKVRERLGEKLLVNSNKILVGNGSSELIELMMKAYLEAGQVVASISPTFSMYKIFTIIHKGNYLAYPLDNMESLNVDGFIEFIREKKAKLVILSNPNNPTGTIIKRQDIFKIIKSVDAMVVLDQAYIEFADEQISEEELIDFDNLVVLRTFSKAIGLAGIRLGYMLANKETIDCINLVRSPYNVNTLSQEMALKALSNDKLIRENVMIIKKERERMREYLEKNGIRPLPSSANFLFFKAPKYLYEGLLEKGILIRDFGLGLDGYHRLTIGSKSENDLVIEAIEEVKNASS